MKLQEAVTTLAARAGGIINLAEETGVPQKALWLARHGELPPPEAQALARKLTDHLRRQKGDPGERTG